MKQEECSLFPLFYFQNSGNNNGGNGGEVDVEDGGIDVDSDGSDKGNGNGGGEWDLRNITRAAVGLVSPPIHNTYFSLSHLQHIPGGNGNGNGNGQYYALGVATQVNSPGP